MSPQNSAPTVIGHASIQSMRDTNQPAGSSKDPGLNSDMIRYAAMPSPKFRAALDTLIQTHLAELAEVALMYRGSEPKPVRLPNDAQSLRAAPPPRILSSLAPRTPPPELHLSVPSGSPATQPNLTDSMTTKEMRDLRFSEDVHLESDVGSDSRNLQKVKKLDSDLGLDSRNLQRVKKLNSDAGTDSCSSQRVKKSVLRMTYRASKFRKHAKKRGSNARNSVPSRASSAKTLSSDSMVAWITSSQSIFQVIQPSKTKQLDLFGDIGESLMDGTGIDEFEYDVATYYKKRGCAQAIARSEIFGMITLFFICCNAVYLGVESDYNKAETLEVRDTSWVVMEHIFCTFFTFEWVCRFVAFNEKRNCLRDGWFKFDTSLVVIMVLDTWVLGLVSALRGGDSVSLPTGPLKMLRLLRLARMARLCSAFPQLATILRAIYVAMRAVGSAVIFLILIIYVFAIAMHSLLKDQDELYPYWGTVTRSMMTLIVNGTLGDSIGLITRAIARHVLAFSCFLLFVLLSAITVINMLIGLLCEVVSEVANAEKEHNTLSRLKSEILVMLKRMDSDDSGTITMDEFMSVLSDDHASAVLEDLGIDIQHVSELVDMMFTMEDNMNIPDVMHLLLASQGDRPLAFHDLVQVFGFTRWIVKTEVSGIKEDLSAIKQHLGSSLDVNKNEILDKLRMEIRLQALNNLQVRTTLV